MIASSLLWLVVLIPLLGSSCIATIDEDQQRVNIQSVAIWTELFVFIACIAMLIGYNRTISLFGFRFYINNISAGFTIMSSVLIGVGTIVGGDEIPGGKAKSFYVFLLLLQSLTVVIFSSGDLIISYISFSMILLTVFFQSKTIAITGVCSSKFVIVLSFGALCLLFGVIYMYGVTGTTDVNILSHYKFTPIQQSTIFISLFCGFACKTALCPFHIWLPDTNTQVPTPMSIVISGMIPAIGIFGMITVLLPIVECSGYQYVVFGISILTIVYATISALLQRDLKRILTYASMVQVGIITIGVFSKDISAMSGACCNTLAYGFIVSTLLVVIRIIEVRFHTRDITKISGIAYISGWLTFITTIPVLTMISVPILPCFTGELLILLALVKTHLPFVILLSVLMMGRMCFVFGVYQKIFWLSKIDGVKIKLSISELCGVFVLIAGIATLSFMSHYILSSFQRSIKTTVMV